MITAEHYAKRYVLWCGRGQSYDQLPRRQRDRWILLHAISRQFSADDVLSEKEVNQRIQDWLLGPGSTMHVDRVSIRRELIDGGFLQRDPAGKEYRRASGYERVFGFEPDVEKLDLPELVKKEKSRIRERNTRHQD